MAVEAIGGTEEAGFLGGVVGEGLSVGYVAESRRRMLVSGVGVVDGSCAGAYRLVRSRHIVLVAMRG